MASDVVVSHTDVMVRWPDGACPCGHAYCKRVPCHALPGSARHGATATFTLYCNGQRSDRSTQIILNFLVFCNGSNSALCGAQSDPVSEKKLSLRKCLASKHCHLN